MTHSPTACGTHSHISRPARELKPWWGQERRSCPAEIPLSHLKTKVSLASRRPASPKKYAVAASPGALGMFGADTLRALLLLFWLKLKRKKSLSSEPWEPVRATDLLGMVVCTCRPSPGRLRQSLRGWEADFTSRDLASQNNTTAD